MLCETKSRADKASSESCSQRNVTYQTWCRECKEEGERVISQEREKEGERRGGSEVTLYTYIGESSRSTYERGSEHLRDARDFNTTSHILKHIIEMHPKSRPEDIKFDMRVIKTHQSAFERQIYESVAIQNMRVKHHMLNSRSEFNRCALPRLGTQLGDREFKKKKEEDNLEREKEENLERMIKEMRKENIKRRRGEATARDQPSRKRAKLNDGSEREAKNFPRISVRCKRGSEEEKFKRLSKKNQGERRWR